MPYIVIVKFLALGLIAHRIWRTVNHPSDIASGDPAGILRIFALANIKVFT
jgi:hypothetical protein